jgi:DNA-binding CsgD family transcriptional regulator
LDGYAAPPINGESSLSINVNKPWEIAEDVLAATSLEELQLAAQKRAGELGFEYHALVMRMPPTSAVAPGSFALHNLTGDAWQQLYGGWASEDNQASDVRFQHVRAGLPATAWSVRGDVSYTRPEIARNARRILQTADNVGLRGGVTVPLYSPGLSVAMMTFSTGSTSRMADLAPAIAPLLYLATCLSYGVRQHLTGSETAPLLSAREREILHWAANGKSSWDIARILTVSDHTVNYHLQRAAKKLGVVGRRAACARALSLGIITL